MVDLGTLLHHGRGLLLAYDHGFEHGLTDFNEQNIDPARILEVASRAGVYTGIILQKGLAEKYYLPRSQIKDQPTSPLPPLIVKLNGKTSFHQEEEPYSPPLGTVEEAVMLGAKAIGYTIYVGSEHEAQMMKEFSEIEKEAHRKDIVVVGWMYPRGEHVKGRETDKEVLAYAARVGLELGCDFIKIHYSGDPASFSWVVKAAGKTGVFVVGGPKTQEDQLLQMAKEIIQAGAVGLAVGRNIWQNSDSTKISQKLAEVIFSENT